MKAIDIYQVDAFSDKAFGGNPAAVCILKEWLEDTVLQNIAQEFNLSETAFMVEKDGAFKLRWFTPKAEVRMCGHATLATGHIVLTKLFKDHQSIEFSTLSGNLLVRKIEDGQYEMELPADNVEAVFYEDGLENLNIEYKSVFQGQDDFLMILESEEEVIKAKPDFKAVRRLEKRGLIITAKGTEVDFVSRCFYPALGIDEDPVTGSAHTLLTPYWSSRMGKDVLSATQLSERKGHLSCKIKGDKVILSGSAKTVISGTLYL